MMENPLQNTTELPLFNQIKTTDIEPAINFQLAENRVKLAALLKQETFTFETLILPLELMENRLSSMWAPISHLNAVCNSNELREVYQRCLQKITEYEHEIGQNEDLCQAVKTIHGNKSFKKLHFSQQKIIENMLQDFRLSGINLSIAEKEVYKKLDTRLTELTNQFENNIVDATDSWSKHITDTNLLEGIPNIAILSAKEEAKKRNLEGYVFTLEFPSYYAIITYANNRALREEIYSAYVTRASLNGPGGKQFDNTPLIEEILKIRHQLAQLLDFKNYAEVSLVTKMAKNTDEVLSFLTELAEKSISKAKLEFNELCQFAKELSAINDLKSWDLAYYSEKLKQHKYSFKEEDLRYYFPEEQVLLGLFNLANRLFNITFKEKNNIEVWHKDVRFFEVFDENDTLRGQFYLDLYARSRKRGGAWVADCRARYKDETGKTRIPATFITCNFSGPTEDTPALFSHDEVITLFHEFGHALHHILTLVDYPSISGTNGMEWDAVELPSQFMENWCWEKSVLSTLSKHYQTGEKIPDELYQQLLAAKNFQAAMAMVRQLEFSLFDFRLHLEYDEKKGAQTQKILDEVRNQVSVMPPPPFNRFQNSFSHIFAGGYAAGYYSYKWAEVLSSDAFSKFEESGLFDKKVGLSFLHHILEMGGSKKALELFKEFRGREPHIDALLRHLGLME